MSASDDSNYQEAWNALRRYLKDHDYGRIADTIAERYGLDVKTAKDLGITPIRAWSRFDAELSRGLERSLGIDVPSRDSTE